MTVGKSKTWPLLNTVHVNPKTVCDTITKQIPVGFLFSIDIKNPFIFICCPKPIKQIDHVISPDAILSSYTTNFSTLNERMPVFVNISDRVSLNDSRNASPVRVWELSLGVPNFQIQLTHRAMHRHAHITLEYDGSIISHDVFIINNRKPSL